MSTPFSGPAVELTVRVRYPQPPLDEDYSELGIHSVRDLVQNEVEAMHLDPGFLLELIESDRSEVSYEFELDDPDDPFAGGSLDPVGEYLQDAFEVALRRAESGA